MSSTLVCDCAIHTIVFFDRFLADERSEQAKFKRAERAQHVLRCKFGADTQCWLLLGANFCGIKGNAKNSPPVFTFCLSQSLLISRACALREKLKSGKKEGCGTKLQSSLHLELFAARLKFVAAFLAYIPRASAADKPPKP